MSFLVCQDGCFHAKTVTCVRRKAGGGYSVIFNSGRDYDVDISTESYQEIMANLSATTRVKELEARIEELELQIFYAPGGPGYLQAKERFEEPK